MFEKDPNRRYLSAEALADDLHRFLQTKPIQARPISTMGRGLRWFRRNPWVGSLAILCIVVFLLGLSGVIWQWQEAERNLDAALRAKAKSIESQLAAQRQSSKLLFQRGLSACRQGRTKEGLLWMVESLRVSPNEPEDQSWQNVIRLNLTGWGQQIDRLTHQLEVSSDIFAIAYSPDADMLVVGTLEGKIHRIDLNTGKRMGPPTILAVSASGQSGITDLSFHPSGDWLLIGASNHEKKITGLVTKVNSHTGEISGSQRVFDGFVAGVAFSPDGSGYAVTENEEGQLWVTVFRTADDSAVTKRIKIKTQAHPITFSTDGSYLLLGLDVVRPDWDAERMSLLDIPGQKLIRSAEALSDMDNAIWSTNELVIPIADTQVRFRAKSYFGSIGLDGGKTTEGISANCFSCKTRSFVVAGASTKAKVKVTGPQFQSRRVRPTGEKVCCRMFKQAKRLSHVRKESHFLGSSVSSPSEHFQCSP